VFGGRRAIVVAADTPCTGLVPQSWREGAAHAADPDPAPPAPPAPAANATDSQKADYWHKMYDLALAEAKKWTIFGVSEAQVVENANGRTRDTIDIVAGCEARDAAAVKKGSR
jgi:hypothetical protein